MSQRRFWITAACCLALTLPLSAQIDPTTTDEPGLDELPLEEVLDSYYDAIGGAEGWSAIQSLKMTGKMVMGPGMEAPFTLYQKLPDQHRLEFSFQGMTGVQAIDGDEAWQFMPFMGKTEPEAMPEEAEEMLREQLDIEGPLINWAAKGHTVEMLGVGQAQGTDAYMVKLTRDNGRIETYYLDGEAFVPFFMETTIEMQGTEQARETTISDYKEVGDGLMLAHSFESRATGMPGGQTITIETVEIDADVSAVEFSMPATTEAEEEAEAAE